MVSNPGSKKRSSSAVVGSAAKDKPKKTGSHAKTDTRCEPSRTVSKPKGLTNLGHSCYVNCILQLLHASPVPAIFLNAGVGHLLDAPDSLPSNKLKVLQQLDAVVQAMHREPTVMPAGVVAAVCEITGLPQCSMQDAHECWLAFADCLDSVVLDNSAPGECRFDPCGGAQGASTLGKYCFGSLFRSTLRCNACGHKSLRNESFMDLPVPLPQCSSSHSSGCKVEPVPTTLAAAMEDTSGRSGLSDHKEQPSGGSGEVLQDPVSRTTSGAVSNSADTSTVDHVSRLVDSRQSTPTAAVPTNIAGDSANPLTAKVESRDLSPDFNSVELEDALQMVFSEEVIEGFRCEGCGEVLGTSKQLSIEQLPRSLVIQVKRFQQDVKLRGHIECPLALNMLRFSSAEMEARGRLDPKQGRLTNDDEEVLEQLRAAKAGMYHLKVVVEHRGKGLNSGHFVSYVLMGSKWFLCNDKSVNEVTWAQVCQAEAYMLLYTMVV